MHSVERSARHQKKRKRELKRLVQKKLYNPDESNQFDLFISGTDIQWCYYRSSKSLLGRTFGMLVLQVGRSSACAVAESNGSLNRLSVCECRLCV